MTNLSEANLAELLILNCDHLDDRIQYYNKDNYYHRIHGPAIIWNNGSYAWYRNGTLHRIGGPAIEYANGEKLWFENGVCIKHEPAPVESKNETDINYLL